MSPSTVVAFSIPIFMLFAFIPVFVLMYLAVFHHVRKLTSKQAIITWACIIAYYVAFLNIAPKFTRPYFEQNSHQITECKVRTVLND